MKKLLSISMLLLWGVVAVHAQIQSPNGTTNEALAVISWNETTHNFGKIAKNKAISTEFTFVNKGTVPMIITEAKGSCGCTVTNYPKDPIEPGKSGKISATYNAEKPGAFSKTVTVFANTSEGKTILSIKGEVIE